MREFKTEELQPLRMSHEDMARLESAWVAVEKDLRERTKGSYRTHLLEVKHKARASPLILARMGTMTLEKGPQDVSLVLDFQPDFHSSNPEKFWLGLAVHNDTFGRQKFEAIWKCCQLPAHVQAEALDCIPGLVASYERRVALAKLRTEEAKKARLAEEAAQKELADDALAVVTGYLTRRGLTLPEAPPATEVVG